jgi:hypothetical protein
MSAFLSVGVDGAGNVYPAAFTAYPATAASGAGANFTWNTQAAASGAAASWTLNVPAPASGTAEAAFNFERAGTSLVKLQAAIGLPTYWALFGGGVTPNATNYMVAGDSANSTVYLNAATTAYIAIGGTPQATFQNGTLVLAAAAMSSSAGVFGITTPFGGATSLPFKYQDNNQTLATSGTTTLSAANQAKPSITIAAVTLTGAATFAFGNIGGAVGTSSAIFFLDISGINAASLATYGLTLTNGTGTITLTSTQIAAAGGLIIVKCNANAITIG